MGILTTREEALATYNQYKGSRSEFARRLDMDERVVRGVLNQGWQSGGKEINGAFRETFPNLFWTQSADIVVDTIRATPDLNTLYGLMNLSMAVEFNTLRNIDPAKSSEWRDPEAHRADPCNDFFGRTYSAMAYFAHISRAQKVALNPREALKCEQILLDKVFQYLDLCASEVPASLLSGRLKLEAVSTKAESFGPNELRALIQKTDFFSAAKELNRISPRFWKVPWNCLSIASKLKERERYQELLDQLARSKFFKTIDDIRGRNTYDSHFDDFDSWLSEGNGSDFFNTDKAKETSDA
ncbi:hypothetical protein LJR257_006768 [Ensifer adhaerens]